MNKKDYYSILGLTDEEKKLPQDEFAKVVKKKYRELARQWHPDKCKDDSKKAEYEEKFKDISEAYSVLSDAQKKNEYDNPQSNFEFNGFNGMDINDILNHMGFGNFGGFGDFFGGFGKKEQTPMGQSIRIQLSISLEDAFNGCEKTIAYKRLDKCPDCNGSGKSSRTTEETCQYCHGQGTIFSNQGFMQSITVCPHCGGKGKIIKNPCQKCGGKGVVETRNEVKFKIPRGVDNGYQFTLTGQGHAPIGGNGEYGNLIIHIAVENSSEYIRQDTTLYKHIKVNLIDAITGGESKIGTIDGKTLSIKVPQGTDYGSQVKIKGYGMPFFGDSSKRGDMICIVEFELPKKITKEEKDLLAVLKTKPNFK